MPVTTDRDKVRLLVGDTDETDPLLYDDEVDACLAQRYFVDSSTGGTTYNVIAAAADAAGAIAAKYARQFSFSEDGQQFQRAQRVGHYQALEKQLRARQGGVSAVVTLAGTAST
jgi:hypothetical protein